WERCMNPIDDDTLQAYVDGELDAAARARVDAALAQDEALARRVRQLQALNARLRAAFDPVLDEPVPEHLSALLQPRSAPAATVVPFGARGTAAARRHAMRSRWLPGAALAASLAMLAAGLWWWQSGSALVRTQGGQQFAAGTLARARDGCACTGCDRPEFPFCRRGYLPHFHHPHTTVARRAGLPFRRGLGAARAGAFGPARRWRLAPSGQRVAASGAGRDRCALARQCFRCAAGTHGAGGWLALKSPRIAVRR